MYDVILHNASVITLDPQRPRGRLVAIKGSQIAWVGPEEDLEGLRGPQTRLIDCEGKTLVPGFNDAHIHILAFASSLLSVDCSPRLVSSIADLQRRIRKRAEETLQGEWIRATGYNEFYLAEKRHPHRRDLDLAAPHHPVRLSHRSGHALALNSLALRLAGITRETPDPPGGMIERDLDTGEPTGLLFGMNAYIGDKVVPPLKEEELRQGIKLAHRYFLSRGLTSLQDATASNGFSQWQMFQSLREKGELRPRIYMMFGLDALSEFQERGMGFGWGDEGLRLGAVKIAIDETKGPLNPPQEELNLEVLLVQRAGFPVALHAIEERTVQAAATALERAQSPQSRHRVEHCSVCPPPLLERLKKIGAVVVTQPPFIYYSGERYLAEVAQPQIPWLYRIGSFLKEGIATAASSDAPVVPPDPLIGLYAAVSRKAETGQAVSPEEAIPPLEALKLYTLGAAYASFEEDRKGSLALGKLADLVLLSADPTQVSPEEIKDIKVEKTIIGGEVVWG